VSDRIEAVDGDEGESPSPVQTGTSAPDIQDMLREAIQEEAAQAAAITASGYLGKDAAADSLPLQASQDAKTRIGRRRLPPALRL